MLNKSKPIARLLTSFFLALFVISSLTACDKAAPPELMKAVKQFESDEIRDKHVAEMRVNHMDALMHKRDETMYNGIRTRKHSLNACINCHVPETHNGEVLRHTNPEHFCSTCHGFVAAQLDCFTCHVDHPVKDEQTASTSEKNPHTFDIATKPEGFNAEIKQAKEGESVSE